MGQSLLGVIGITVVLLILVGVTGFIVFGDDSKG